VPRPDRSPPRLGRGLGSSRFHSAPWRRDLLRTSIWRQVAGRARVGCEDGRAREPRRDERDGDLAHSGGRLYAGRNGRVSKSSLVDAPAFLEPQRSAFFFAMSAAVFSLVLTLRCWLVSWWIPSWTQTLRTIVDGVCPSSSARRAADRSRIDA
jgi:hypothetical protein